MQILKTSEISVFSGTLTKVVLAKNIINIKNAFPALPASFYDLFSDRIIELGWNNDRLTAAVNHVIDNCQFSKPSLASFLSFDVTFKTFNYLEACNILSENRSVVDYLVAVRLPLLDIPRWVYKEDFIRFNLSRWSK